MNKEFYNYLCNEINEIKSKSLLRYVKSVSANIIQMSSNNYLGLAGDIRLQEAAIEAISKYGIGSTGSRLISGTHELHLKLENHIAELKGTEKALVYSTGYAANIGIISALLTEADAVYSDQLNHASIIDGIKLARTNKFIYRHCDVKHLEQLLSDNHNKYRFNVIITDSIFSMDGDTAPLTEIVKLKEKYGAVLYIDEAHAFGVYGSRGQGLAHKLGINEHVDIQMGTLSKAAGSEGGYIAGKKELIEYLINKSRSFIYSTAPSIPSIAASIKAVEIIGNDNELRSKLYENIDYFKQGLLELEKQGIIELFPTDSAIFCIKVGNTEETLRFSQNLLEKHNIMASAIRPPTVDTPRIRLCVNSLLNKSDLDMVLDKICIERRACRM